MKYDLNQMGIVVEDINEAMKQYGEMYGIKKWYVTHPGPGDKQYYRGKEVTDKELKLNLGYNGKFEIELIETSRDDNMYADFLKEHGPGPHHVCLHLRNLDKAVTHYKKMGFEILQEGDLHGDSSYGRYAYVARPGEENRLVVELSETAMFGGKYMTIRGKPHVILSALTGAMDVIKTKDLK